MFSFLFVIICFKYQVGGILFHAHTCPVRLQPIKGQWVSWLEANELCSLCFQTQLTINLDNEDYPYWLGATCTGGGCYTRYWKWISNNETIKGDFLYSVKFPETYGSLGTYGILVNRSDNFQRMYHAYWDDTRKNVNIVCQHPTRKDCSYQNVTESVCRYTEKHGCHKHIVTLVYDNEKGACPLPTTRSFGIQCPASECTCKGHATQWSVWTPCSSVICEDGVGQKTRTRSILPACNKRYLKTFHDFENESCTVGGCSDLINELNTE